MSEHKITIECTDLEEKLLQYLCDYEGTTSKATILSQLLQSKINEELKKNYDDVINYKD